ncbi:FkbM family methyltransferase [Pedobacter sp. P351]|uniref:FkbM family methyltransferase n=1 Tax=Pedobacter superstes TaxID=3133441 RepID=UPI00309B4BCE
MSYQRLYSCQKEPGTVSWVTSNLSESGVFYDIGANTGAYSLIGGSRLNAYGKVYAFEPVPSTFIELCQNVQLNKLEEKVIPINVALSDSNSVVPFGLNSFSGGVAMHMGLSDTEILANSDETVFNYLIRTQTLDSLVKEFNLLPPTIIKIDVDGPEFKVLKGASNVLKSEKLLSLQIEMDELNQPIKEMTSFLEDHGLIFKDKYQHGNSEIFDYVFERKV